MYEAAVHTALDFSLRGFYLFRELRVMAGVERAVAEITSLLLEFVARVVWTAFRNPFVPVLASVSAEDEK